ncbi:MAG: efflux RND transporter periplasmic adaptor subunit [Gammaproteobacteria bacterium]|nr:efflux RND transporter periplasmic adaptor subunit [Gammaproteobacteria bacterium]
MTKLTTQNSFGQALFWVFVGILLSVSGHYLFNLFVESKSAQTDSGKPLYWVAPMDPNYRRDKPGKSPMGMDLVPVYEEPSKDVAGAVAIPPQLAHNLGMRRGKVAFRALDQSINSVGYVQYNEDALIHIHPRVAGWIERLMVGTEGDPVRKGEPLYQLYSPELVNAQEELLIALQRNNTTLIQAAEARLRALQMDDASIKAISQQRKVMQQVTFYAPQSGVVDNLNVREGFYVQPGTTLMSIGSLASVWVEVELFERQAGWVKLGDTVEMSVDYLPNEQWNGTVDYIYPTLNAATRTLKVRVEFDNANQLLKPNMFAQVKIKAQTESSVLTVPREAVIRTGEQDRVVVEIEDNQFKAVAVKVGRSNQEYFEILSGLNDGDSIVTSAQFLIDSESSKTSDFKRMSAPSDETQSVWTSIEVVAIDAQNSLVTARHEAIDSWQWPAMTMDFYVADVETLNALSAGMSLHAELAKPNDDSAERYQITAIHIMENMPAEDYPSATVTGKIIAISDGTLTIHRDAIENWQREATTIDFKYLDNVEVSQLAVGDKVLFTFEVRDDFVITALEKASDPQAVSPQEVHHD